MWTEYWVWAGPWSRGRNGRIIISETSEASYSYRTENVVREAILLYQPVAICIMILKHFSLASIWPLVSCLA